MKACAFMAVLVAVCLLLLSRLSPAAQLDKDAVAKGFWFPAEYYPATNGVQKPKTIIRGSNARFLTNDLIYVIDPRIESMKEDGTLEWVATSLEALINRSARNVIGTNVASFRSGDTNIFVSGNGFSFRWNQTNQVLIIYKQAYTWINQVMLTNTSGKATNDSAKR
jgi:hypothetical protein